MTGGNNSSSSTPKYEPFSEFYLHPSEGTGTTISPILLKGDNYEDWSKSLCNNLRAKNKLGFIDGTIKVPDSTSPHYAQWGIVNSMLVAWIYNTLDASVRSTVRFPDNVKTLWDDLQARYSLGNGPRILELKAQIADCRQNGRSVATYYGELRKLQDVLGSYQQLPPCTCSASAAYIKLQDSELLHQFCIGLDNKKFGSAVSTLLMQDPIPSLNVAYAKIIADERKQLVSESKQIDHPNVVGFAANGSSSQGISGRGSRKCSHCGRSGHDKEYCYQLVGYPEGWRGRVPGRGRGFERGGRGGRSIVGRGFAGTTTGGRGYGSSEITNDDRLQAPTLTDDQWAQFLSAIKNTSSGSSNEKISGTYNSDDWIIDTGASNHMSGNIDLFFDLCDVNSPVGLPNGKSTLATKEGKIKLANNLILEHVLYVPALACNLLSVSQLLTQSQFIVYFTNKLCIIQDHTLKNLIGAGVQSNGIYFFRSVPTPWSQANSVGLTDLGMLWHRRLGHPSMKVLHLLPGLSSNKHYKCDINCSICFMGKQPRNIFPLSTNKASALFELIHCDIWGPYKILSTCNARYFLTIVDDFSRATWVFLMVGKYEVAQLIIDFCSMVKTQFNTKVKMVRSDNGQEFLSLGDFFFKKRHNSSNFMCWYRSTKW